MISRSTLIGALVVVELAIVGAAVDSFSGLGGSPEPHGFGWSGTAQAGTTTPLDRRFATGPAPHVVVDVGDVSVVVRAAAGSGVHVLEQVKRVGWISGSLAPVQAEQTADGVRISSHGGSGLNVVMGGLEHDLIVTVPATAAVEVTSTDRIEATGLRARFAAHTDDGSVHVHDQRGDLDLSTNDGRIELVDVEAADVTARTADGRLILTRVVADRLRASTDDGRIQATDVRLADGAITTKDGRASVAFTPDSDATLTVRTADGRIDLAAGLTGDPAAADARADAESDRQERVVRLGSGRGRFEVSTGSGPISIAQGAHV